MVVRRVAGFGIAVSGVAVVSSALAAGCTPQVCVDDCGAGGGTSGASMSSSGSKASSGATSGSTASGTSTSTSSSAASTTGASTSTSGTTTSSSSSSVSTGATMGGTFAPCGGVVDDFNGYASDADFMAIGEAGGPWAEAGQSANVVNWVPTAAIRTHAENGTPGVLHVKNVMSLAGASCAISVRVKNVQNENAFFGFVDQIANPTKLATITMAESAGADVDIEVFGFPSITTELPVDLAVVVSGGQVYGAYDDGTGWKKLPGLPGGALDVATAIGASAYAAMGKTTNGDAFWDDFGTSVPTVLPN